MRNTSLSLQSSLVEMVVLGLDQATELAHQLVHAAQSRWEVEDHEQGLASTSLTMELGRMDVAVCDHPI